MSIDVKPKMDLKAKLAAAQAAAQAAKDAISKDEREEIDLRAKIAKAEEEARIAEREKRELDLDRRFEAARDQLGPEAKIAAVAIDGYTDTFIVKHDSAAYQVWEDQIGRSQLDKKIKREDVSLNYACDVVVDWNGITDWSDSEKGAKLIAYLKANRGIVSSLVNAAAKLAGSFQEARKSTC